MNFINKEQFMEAFWEKRYTQLWRDAIWLSLGTLLGGFVAGLCVARLWWNV